MDGDYKGGRGRAKEIPNEGSLFAKCKVQLRDKRT